MQIAKFDINEIIKALRIAVPAFGNRIWRGPRVVENPDGHFCIVRNISQSLDSEIERFVRVEFRIFSQSADNTFGDIDDLVNALESAVWGETQFGAFKAYKVVAGSNFMDTIDEHGRRVVLRDYMFYHLT